MDRIIMGFIFHIDDQSRIDIKGLGIYSEPCEELIDSIKNFIMNQATLDSIQTGLLINTIDKYLSLIIPGLFYNDNNIHRLEIPILDDTIIDKSEYDIEIYSIPLNKITEFKYANQ